MGNVDSKYIIEVEGYDIAMPAIPKATKVSAKLVKESHNDLLNYYYDTGLSLIHI